MRDLGNSPLIWTPDTWSLWGWDQALLACWLELWDLAPGEQVERLSSRRRAVQSLAFSPDSRQVAVATMQDFFVMRIEV